MRNYMGVKHMENLLDENTLSNNINKVETRLYICSPIPDILVGYIYIFLFLNFLIFDSSKRDGAFALNVNKNQFKMVRCAI